MSSDPKIENQPPSAWVWSQYRGEVSEPRTAARETMTASNRERPPLIPQQSGIATGPMLVALILLAAGMAWWFSGAQHKPETATQENAEPAEPAASDAAEPSAEPAPAEPQAQAPSAEPAAPADAEPQAEPEKKPEPAKERPKKKKKKH